MNVAVLIAGIADPKWPLGAPQPRIASPFDESALEVALKLRDVDPGTTLTMLVAVLPGERVDESLARAIASHRPDHLRRAEVPAAIEWDIRAQAALWGAVIAELPLPCDLVVMGREFGDRDDGSLPACLAAALEWPFAALIQEIRAVPGGLELMRERGSVEERIERAPPVLASITNDRRNRLRHPLMKNVMAAKRMPIEGLAPPPGPARVVLEALAPAASAPRAAQCRMLEGSVEGRVDALAEFLRPWRPEA